MSAAVGLPGGSLCALYVGTGIVQPGAARGATPPGLVMLDLIYIGGTIAFFALMAAYVRACARLGRTASDDTDHRS